MPIWQGTTPSTARTRTPGGSRRLGRSLATSGLLEQETSLRETSLRRDKSRHEPLAKRLRALGRRAANEPLEKRLRALRRRAARDRFKSLRSSCMGMYRQNRGGREARGRYTKRLRRRAARGGWEGLSRWRCRTAAGCSTFFPTHPWGTRLRPASLWRRSGGLLGFIDFQHVELQCGFRSRGRGTGVPRS